MAAPTERPWRKAPAPDPDRIWIEGAEGTAASDRFPKDRFIIVDRELTGDPKVDAEIDANFDLIVALANVDAGFPEGA